MARQIMSEPSMAGVNTCFCTGNIAWMPLACSAPTVTSDSPQLTSCMKAKGGEGRGMR